MEKTTPSQSTTSRDSSRSGHWRKRSKKMSSTIWSHSSSDTEFQRQRSQTTAPTMRQDSLPNLLTFMVLHTSPAALDTPRVMMKSRERLQPPRASSRSPITRTWPCYRTARLRFIMVRAPQSCWWDGSCAIHCQCPQRSWHQIGQTSTNWGRQKRNTSLDRRKTTTGTTKPPSCQTSSQETKCGSPTRKHPR